MVNRERAAVAALIVAGALGLWLSPRALVPEPAAPGERAGKRGASGPLRIDLARIEGPREPETAGRRDLFDFGPDPTPEPTPTPGSTPTPEPVEVGESTPTPPPPPPTLPPLNVTYFGLVEDKSGLKVAVLLTDRNEVLTGKRGDVVANRFKIVQIGLESIDVQDLGSERVRRLPLKGN